MIESLAVAGYIALLLYGIWLLADGATDWLAGRIKND